MPTPLADYYADFGRRWAHGTSPLFEEWAVGIAGDERMLELIAALPQRQQQANLLFAAARWEGCPLVAYAPWREWLLAHWDAVVQTALARSTQTNEVGRCATLLPVLSRLDGPLALLEVGAAAGLCLLPDRYSYRYEAPSGVHRLDPAAGPSAVPLECRIADDAAVPDRMPEIVWRRGIDLNPIDPGDADAVEWLATLVWPGPDNEPRVTRLRAAAAVAAPDPPEVIRGDLLESLDEVAGTAPPEATLVVFHSAVLLYLDVAERRRFADLVRGLGDRIGRRVVWLSNESKGTLAEIDAQLPTGLETSQRFIQTVDGRAVALTGQHGATYARVPAPA